MAKNLGEISKDFKKYLNLELRLEDLTIHTSGVSGCLVVQIKDDYLYKFYRDEDEYKKIKTFCEYYADTPYFQNIVFDNKDEKAICFKFIKGEMLYGKEGDYSYLIEQIYEIVKSYKLYEKDDIEYYNYGNKTWKENLENWVNLDKVDGLFDQKIIDKNLEIIGNHKIQNYIIHGDTGSHNYIINNAKICVIDPQIFIGDKLFDFYFGVFSDPIIFEKLTLDEVLNYFDEYDLEYKKALLTIAFIIRAFVAYRYNYYKNKEIFMDWFNKYLN